MTKLTNDLEIKRKLWNGFAYTFLKLSLMTVVMINIITYFSTLNPTEGLWWITIGVMICILHLPIFKLSTK